MAIILCTGLWDDSVEYHRQCQATKKTQIMRDKIHRLIGAGDDLRIAKYPALDVGRKSIEASETTGNV